MTFEVQKSFGDFIKERVGPKWVYVQRNSDRIAGQYPNSAIILPKQQRELAIEYKKEWGAEYDRAAWFALCALRATKNQIDYPSFDEDTKSMVDFAIAALTT